MITRREIKKKVYLILCLGVLLGWTLHVLTVNLIVAYHRDSIPDYRPTIATIGHAQEKAQVYQVTIYNLFGRIVARFKGGVALWNKPELIKRLFIARFKPGTAVYIYRVYAPSGEYKQGKILIGKDPDPGAKGGFFSTVAYAGETRKTQKLIEEFSLTLPEKLPFGKRSPEDAHTKDKDFPVESFFDVQTSLSKALQVISQTLKLKPGLYNLMIVAGEELITIEFLVSKGSVMVQGQPYSQSLSNIDES